MDDKKLIIPDSGCIFAGETPAWMPKVRSIKRGYKNNATIEVKRTIQPGVHILKPGESIDWRKAYSRCED